jgi:hypothetical protein
MGVLLAGAYVIETPERLLRKIDRGGWDKEENRQYYGKRYCPDAFVDICWEFFSESGAPSPSWETYKRIVEHLREKPLPLDDERSRKVYQGVRQSLTSKPLTDGQHAAVLADAAHFIQSPKAGDGVSAAVLLGALARNLLPVHRHLSSPDERWLAGEVASLLVPAFERALAELSDAAKEARLRIDAHDAAFALARAELCLGSAYEFAAFVEQDPAEKKRLFAEAFAVYARRATESRPWFLQMKAGVAGSRVAATDGQRHLPTA